MSEEVARGDWFYLYAVVSEEDNSGRRSFLALVSKTRQWAEVVR